MFEKIDRACLQLAEKASKWFNWLTGKNNFYMARGVMKIYCAYVAILIIVWAKDHMPIHIFLLLLSPI